MMMSTAQEKLPVKRKRIDSTPPPPTPPPGSRVQVRWSDLNKDVLSVIFQKLKDYDSHDNNNTIYRCGNVCVSWQSIARAILPRYLLLSNVQNLKNKNSCVLFNLFTESVSEISLPEELKGRWFTASSFGWMLTISINSPHKIALINPFSPAQKIELPDTTNISKLRNFNRGLRVITSTNPLDPNCIFVAIHGDSFGRTPAFCKLGDKSWTIMSEYVWGVCSWEVFSDDARFYKGKFYSVDLNGNFFRVRLNSSSSFSFMMHYWIDYWPVPKSQTSKCENINYLVELNGDLLLVRRKREYIKTIGFDVYKWIEEEKEWSTDPEKDIGNNVMLLGKYSSVTIPAGPVVGDLKANCIYFIDDVGYPRSEHDNDAGVYNIASQKIDSLPESWPIWTSPVNWLSPML
ncbi:hypothetical protein LWI29_017610 [Acer saccharum]|uniref:KIB1-4 beta-propeller domain-containing protein n=1 Tax=Acer saccharum TaxID=4024 RepID=A0AA39W315_ACESA|nr:hypothetical protein LWI29_017610 [Acer saccharum]